MSNAAVFMRWGAPLPGREQKSLETFMAVTEHFGALKAQGAISDFRTYLTTNAGLGDFGGFMLVEGSVEQLRKVVDSDAYKDLSLKARHLVSGVEQVHCVTGADVATEVQRTMRIRKELGI